MVIPGNIESLIDFFSFTAWLFYGVTMLALVLLRYKLPYKERYRPYRVHISIPIIVFFISIYLVVAPIIENPQIEYLYATLYILSGVVVYIPFVKYKVRCTKLTGKLIATINVDKKLPTDNVPPRRVHHLGDTAHSERGALRLCARRGGRRGGRGRREQCRGQGHRQEQLTTSLANNIRFGLPLNTLPRAVHSRLDIISDTIRSPCLYLRLYPSLPSMSS